MLIASRDLADLRDTPTYYRLLESGEWLDFVMRATGQRKAKPGDVATIANMRRETMTNLSSNPFNDFAFNVNQPRWPKGTPGKGGKWMGGVSGANGKKGSTGVSPVGGGKSSPPVDKHGEPLHFGGRSRLTAIEAAGLNDWPPKDQKAKDLLGDANDTQELHSIPREDGQRDYHPDRKALHDEIINDMLKKGKPAQGKKQALFMGGGTASGKSSALKKNPEVVPDNAVVIDPDKIKERLPEYKQLTAAGSKYNAAAAHEESSDIAKMLTRRASDGNYNLVVDGTGDSKPGKFPEKIEAMHDKGYDTSVFYVSAPTEVAIDRAVDRALEEGRWVPVPEIRKQHKGVSQNFPGVAELPFVKNIRVFDSTSFNHPVEVARGGEGNLDVLDPDLYRQFLDKSGE